MMRVERLVTPEAKSFCSSRRVRFPARAHSRAIATPFMPPPMTTTWKCWPSSEGRGFRAKLMISKPENGCMSTGLNRRELRLLVPVHDFACFARGYEGDDSPACAAHLRSEEHTSELQS